MAFVWLPGTFIPDPMNQPEAAQDRMQQVHAVMVLDRMRCPSSISCCVRVSEFDMSSGAQKTVQLLLCAA